MSNYLANQKTKYICEGIANVFQNRNNENISLTRQQSADNSELLMDFMYIHKDDDPKKVIEKISRMETNSNFAGFNKLLSYDFSFMKKIITSV